MYKKTLLPKAVYLNYSDILHYQRVKLSNLPHSYERILQIPSQI